MSGFDVGLFLPIGEHGFILSRNAPPIHATYGYNKEVTLLAESLGFDFVFSMIKYRGIGVETPFWHSTLESISLSAALAECTNRIELIGSVSTLTIPPAVMAKIVTTIDHVSHGRFGLNIVTGSFPSEMQQMNLWRLDHDTRYDDAAEYVTCMRRLWTEDRVTFSGDYYSLDDCESSPKPVRKPSPPVVCAGISDKGLRFTAQYGDCAFLGGSTLDVLAEKSAEVKQLASEVGRTVRSMACVVPIGGRTDDEAQARYRHYVDGRDTPGVEFLMNEFGIRGGALAEENFNAMMFFGTPVVGTADTVAETLLDLHQHGVDGVVLMLPDYIEDQVWIAEHVMPKLRESLARASNEILA